MVVLFFSLYYIGLSGILIIYHEDWHNSLQLQVRVMCKELFQFSNQIITWFDIFAEMPLDMFYCCYELFVTTKCRGEGNDYTLLLSCQHEIVRQNEVLLQKSFLRRIHYYAFWHLIYSYQIFIIRNNAANCIHGYWIMCIDIVSNDEQ